MRNVTSILPGRGPAGTAGCVVTIMFGADLFEDEENYGMKTKRNPSACIF